MKSEREEKHKKAYEKPKLRAIELAAEEVLATGCKIANGAPGGGKRCNNAPCRNSIGS